MRTTLVFLGSRAFRRAVFSSLSRWAFSWLAIPWSILAAATPDPTVTVYVVLQGEPSCATFLRAKIQGPSTLGRLAETQSRQQQIQAQHRQATAGIEALRGRVTGRFSRLVNALRVTVPSETLPALAKLPGVSRVLPAARHQRLTSTSVPFIGAPRVWAGAKTKATGKGIRIGIIDAGIDYLHMDFGGDANPDVFAANDSTVIEPGTFPTAKVVGGYDFVGDNYDADVSGQDVPQPDPDPLDTAEYGHGTHVAGIAAGYGVLTNNTTFNGPYTNNLTADQFKIGPGVAPEASLYALKIFGRSGTTAATLDALEWAADPNGNGNFNDRLDVVNLSLGSAFGLMGTGDPETEAINRLADLGCVVVIAAGNDGNTFYIASAPGIAEKGICVANSIDDGTTSAGLRVLSPAAIAGIYSAVEGAFTVAMGSLDPLQAEIVYAQPGDACEDLANPGALYGKIALMDRGTCNFVYKVQRAQDAGALAVIMVNNVASLPIVMGGTPDYTVTIPGVMISQSDGALIKAHLEEHPQARLDKDIVFVHRELADQLSGDSSRGPALPNSLLKPDVAAPGFGIASAKAGSGVEAVTYSGTSMAAPHVAGAAALLRQLHPDWPAEEIKAALMNTAVRTHDSTSNYYGESIAGAGRIDVERASRALVTARAENSAGLVSLNLGARVLTQPIAETHNLVLQNHDTSPVSYSVVVSNTLPQAGFSVVPLQSNVLVPARGTILLPLRVKADPRLLDSPRDPTTPSTANGFPRFALGEASGEIWLQNSNLSLHVPYYASIRPGSTVASRLGDVAIPDAPIPLDMTLPTTGASAHPQPLVSAFQLGATNTPNPNLVDSSAPAELIAVGAASDAPVHPLFADSTLFFAMATSGEWATPSGFQAEFTVEIDLDADGYAEYSLYNSTAGNVIYDSLKGTYATDVFMPVLRDEMTGEATTNFFTNVFPPNTLDTAIFNNSVLVLPVSVTNLGLSTGQSTLQYRVLSTGPHQRNSPSVSQTGWISFDAAHPMVDTTTYGITNTPFFPDGGPVRVNVDRSAAADNGMSSTGTVGMLLLHHFNTADNRVEIVNLHLDSGENVPLVMVPPFVAADGITTLRWASSSGHTYTVLTGQNLSQGITNTAVANQAATPPFNSYTVPKTNASAQFFRIQGR